MRERLAAGRGSYSAELIGLAGARGQNAGWKFFALGRPSLCSRATHPETKKTKGAKAQKAGSPAAPPLTPALNATRV